jgi:tricarballylate dehydrogenase
MRTKLGQTRPAGALRHDIDVLIVGGGCAGLCAAIAARQCGASVQLIEWAPSSLRGGNSRHARNFRVAHPGPTAFVDGSYSENAFLDDIFRVTRGNIDLELARILVRESVDIADWLVGHGVRLEPRGQVSRPPSARTAFLLGGGKAMINALSATAIRVGVNVAYDSQLVDFDAQNDDECVAMIRRHGQITRLVSRAAVVAAGGNQADVSALRPHLGQAVDNIVIRGTRYAPGLVLQRLVDYGMQPIGDPSRSHMVAVDARSPWFDGGIVTRINAIPFGIVVNRDGVRFSDEGADVERTHFSRWGALICDCPDQIAFLILDTKSRTDGVRSPFPPIAANDIRTLAGKLQLDGDRLEDTILRFNVAATGSDDMAPNERATVGLTPPKSRYAIPLTGARFACYPMRPGLTSTYLGVAVSSDGRVRRADGSMSRRLFAAGSIMAANILREGHLSGLGITIATVFGRLAGQAAAHEALDQA